MTLFDQREPGGGGAVGLKYARMCVSKIEGNGFFFGFKRLK